MRRNTLSMVISNEGGIINTEIRIISQMSTAVKRTNGKHIEKTGCSEWICITR